METGAQRRTSSSLPAIGLLLIIAGAFYVSRSRLESSRPEMPLGLGYAVPEKDKIEARLWQDPFKVALDHKKTPHSSGTNETGKDAGTCQSLHCVNQISERISNILREKTDEPNVPTVQVLLTIVRDGDFAEDHERRLRNRYAMLSALHLSGFTPEDSEHIQYFELEWTEKDELAKNILNRRVPTIHKLSKDGSEPLIVPFEWLRREGLYPPAGVETSAKDPCEYVAVAWLPESAFSHRPLTRLAQVINAIDPANRSNVKANRSNVRIDVIGPSYSETLRAMIDEIKPIRRNKSHVEDLRFVDVNSMLEGLTIFSPWSTVSPALLVRDWPVQHPNDDSPLRLYEVIPKKFHDIGVEFVRTIGSDDLLAMALINELCLRGIDVLGDSKGDGDHVALISEWDTLYGKTFPLTFAAMIESIDLKTGRPRSWIDYARRLHNKMVVQQPRFLRNLCVHHYIRAVDGRLPQTESAKEKEPSGQEESKSKWAYSRNLELPIGRGQLDYVRRLAQQMDAEHEADHKLLGRIKLGAIGVVGSDVYDKLVLFHALREQFGDVILFMTDLDARMMHDERFKWTRNVIVASNFGLRLHEDYQRAVYQQGQGEVPPFRDNYQTALFLACRIALGLREKLPEGNHPNNKTGDTLRNDPDKIRKSIINPRLFEIGRGRPVNLSVLPKKNQEDTNAINIHPPHSRWPGAKIFLRALFFVVLAIVACALLLVQLSPGLLKALIPGKPRKDQEELAGKDKPIMARWITWLMVAVVIAVVITATVDHYRPKGEPFSLGTGVSIWPGEALRLIAVILSVYFIFKSLRELENNEEKLYKWFELEDPDGLRKSAISYRKWRDDEKLSGWSRFPLNPHTWWRYRRERIGIHSWDTGMDKDQKDKVKASQLWREYLDRGTRCNRFHRLIPMSLTYSVLGIALMATLGLPNRPYRGDVSSFVDFALLSLSVSFMIILIFFVVDATKLSLKFIRNLKDPHTRWPVELIRRLKVRKDDNSKEADGHVGHSARSAKDAEDDSAGESNGLAEWLDIRFIASHTQAAGKLIYYPFIVLLIMFAARNRYFDNWDFPISLIIIFLMNSTYALVGAMMLRIEAEKARRVAMDRLQEKLVEATRDCDDCRSKYLEAMIEEIRFIRRGAFSPFTENPVVRIVFASGGVGLLTLLRFLPQS